jgi:hypothetical protein
MAQANKAATISIEIISCRPKDELNVSTIVPKAAPAVPKTNRHYALRLRRLADL